MALRLLKFLPDDGYHDVNEKLPEPNTQLHIRCDKNPDNVGGGAATFEDGKWYWSYDYMRSEECVYPVKSWSYMGYPGPNADTIEYLNDRYADEIKNMYQSECGYHFYIPHNGMYCDYYSKTVDAYGMRYAHYHPHCKKENCPLKNPELIEGRKPAETTARCKTVGIIPPTARNKKCFFCDTSLNVKYIVEVDLVKKSSEPFRVHSCINCATIKNR